MHMCNQHHHPSQDLGQAEASTGTETATLGHHPHNPALITGSGGACELAYRLCDYCDKCLTACLLIFLSIYFLNRPIIVMNVAIYLTLRRVSISCLDWTQLQASESKHYENGIFPIFPKPSQTAPGLTFYPLYLSEGLPNFLILGNVPQPFSCRGMVNSVSQTCPPAQDIAIHFPYRLSRLCSMSGLLTVSGSDRLHQLDLIEVTEL